MAAIAETYVTLEIIHVPIRVFLGSSKRYNTRQSAEFRNRDALSGPHTPAKVAEKSI